MISVKLEQVSKHFNKTVAVEKVDLDIRPGEFFTFLGPSGCGKTTTLRMIAGFYYPSTGRIWFGEQDITRLPPHKRNTGMVFQNYALFPHLTVSENIAFGLEVRKVPKTEMRERIEQALAMVRLQGMGERRIDQLSGGQQQRVALARALVIKPGILLLDEPLSNLDAKLREETRSEIKRLQLELGITTIYVTHDQAEAMAMSDRLMVMERGRVQQTGSPVEVYNCPANTFVASFIGETNLLEGVVTAVDSQEVQVRINDHIQVIGLKANSNPRVNFAEGSKVTVSVRPEAFRLIAGPNDNIVSGKVALTEFTGVNVSYLVQSESYSLRALFINQGAGIRARGEAITLALAKDQVFFVE